jgi:NDP-sugar pyrophosphorylase family protein
MIDTTNVLAMILCLGSAVRMRPLSLAAPKHLIPFCGRPLVEYTLEELARHGIDRVVLVTGPADSESDIYRTWNRERGMNVRVVKRGLEFGSAGVVNDVAGEALLGELPPGADLLVIYGDSLVSLDWFRSMLAVHRASKSAGALITVACHQPEELVIAGQSRTNYGILALNEEGRVTRFQEKPPVGEIFSRYASAGVFLLDPRAFDFFPPRHPSDLSADVIAPAAGESSPVFGFDISPGYRYDIGTLPAFLELSLDFLRGRLELRGAPERFSPGRQPAFSGCEIQGHVLIGAGSVIDDDVVLCESIVGRNVLISEASRIRNSIVLDGTWVGKGVRMDRSIVGPAARIGDGCYLGEGTVVGGWSVVNTVSTHDVD